MLYAWGLDVVFKLPGNGINGIIEAGHVREIALEAAALAGQLCWVSPSPDRLAGATLIHVPRQKPFTVLVGEYMSLAFLLPMSTLAGYVIGYLLDKAFGTHWLYIPFLILGIVSGFVQLIRTLLRDTRNDR